jgi:hypothetical protein
VRTFCAPLYWPACSSQGVYKFTALAMERCAANSSKKNRRGTRSKAKRNERESQWIRKELATTVVENNLQQELAAAAARLAACPNSSEALHAADAPRMGPDSRPLYDHCVALARWQFSDFCRFASEHKFNLCAMAGVGGGRGSKAHVTSGRFLKNAPISHSMGHFESI